MRRLIACMILSLFVSFPATAQKQFGFDNRKPSGQPYLKPQETVKKFEASPGYEVKLFAGEPDVINPIAFTIDENGRLWVVENFEYPKRTPKGKKPRDRIKILEDTTGDGKADKITVWAEGKNLPIGWDLASGIEVGNGGVYLGAPPYLFFLRDTDGDGKCDKQEVLLKGFGSQDTHETLNTFQWGPDGKLYGLHGVFTHSEVDGVRLNAAVWRYDARRKDFEIFAEGTSNPWGMDFDSYGQCHLVCCVIPHMFHMVPGGAYIRQAGSSFNPYAYGLLKQSCDHTHHKESGWAHAGLLFLDGDHVPKAYRGSLIMGSIHGCSIKRDSLHRNGSTFIAGHEPDFVISGDKNFRPINLRWGPDGSIYVIDWHDQNPCHQAHPDSWDKERGRIYRIQRKGHQVKLPADLAKRNSKQLVSLLENDNPWWYRTALRVLHERQDQSVTPLLKKMLFSANEKHALRALWGMYAVGAFNDEVAAQALQHSSLWVRSWGVRLLGEANEVSPKMLAALTELADKDKSPEVRLQLASTAQRLTKQDVLPVLHNLMKHKKDVSDPFIPLMLWLAYEPRLQTKRNPALNWLKKNAAGNPLVTAEIVPRTMRRLVSSEDADDLKACIEFLGEVSDAAVRREALQGMLTALKNRKLKPPPQWRTVFVALLRDPNNEVQQLARKLAIHFQDPQAIKRALALAQNTKARSEDRIDALRDLALTQPDAALDVLLNIVGDAEDVSQVRAEAIRRLGSFSDNKIAAAVLAKWKTFSPEMKVAGVNLLTGRKQWAAKLLEAVGRKKVARTALNDNHILKIHAFNDPKLKKQAEEVWGKFRETPEQLNALLNKMWSELDEGRASFARGKRVFADNCAKCHKFDGQGHDVGPNLDGASRELDYLLINILDPNRVVGQPYFTRIVELKDGRIETGLLHAEDPKSITLKVENNALKLILKKDIAGKVLVQPKSVMPEGLDKNMSVQDFRDLLRYVMAHPFLTDVAVAGPFPAAKAPQVNRQNPLKSDGMKWSKPLVGVTGKIQLPEGKGEEETVALVTAQLRASAALKTQLRLGTASWLRVWLNGKLVFKGKPGSNEAAPDQVSVPVEIEKGENHLLFEVRYRDDQAVLFARFLDRDRQLSQGDSPE